MSNLTFIPLGLSIVNLAGRPVAAHFNQPDHSLNHVSVTGILSTSGNSDFERHVAEQGLINSLKTLKPSGINVKFDIFKAIAIACITVCFLII